jgi:hypothetical protein
MLEDIAIALCSRQIILRDWHNPSLVVRVAMRLANVVARSAAVPRSAGEEHGRVPPRQARAARSGEPTAACRVASHAGRGSGLSGSDGREKREESIQEGRHQRATEISMP